MIYILFLLLKERCENLLSNGGEIGLELVEYINNFEFLKHGNIWTLKDKFLYKHNYTLKSTKKRNTWFRIDTFFESR